MEKKHNSIENNLFQTYLKGLRKRKNYTQQEMANELGISYRTYQDIEHGKNKLLSESSRKILKNLDIKILGPDGEVIM